MNHTFSGSFLRNQTESTDLPTINDEMSMTASTLVDRQNPNKLWVVNYNGVLTNSAVCNLPVVQEGLRLPQHRGAPARRSSTRPSSREETRASR